jgi:uncharacterized membrane protein
LTITRKKAVVINLFFIAGSIILLMGYPSFRRDVLAILFILGVATSSYVIGLGDGIIEYVQRSKSRKHK